MSQTLIVNGTVPVTLLDSKGTQRAIAVPVNDVTGHADLKRLIDIAFPGPYGSVVDILNNKDFRAHSAFERAYAVAGLMRCVRPGDAILPPKYVYGCFNAQGRPVSVVRRFCMSLKSKMSVADLPADCELNSVLLDQSLFMVHVDIIDALKERMCNLLTRQLAKTQVNRLDDIRNTFRQALDTLVASFRGSTVADRSRLVTFQPREVGDPAPVGQSMAGTPIGSLPVESNIPIISAEPDTLRNIERKLDTVLEHITSIETTLVRIEQTLVITP